MSADIEPHPPIPVIELREHGRPVAYRLPDAAGRTLAGSGILETTPDPYEPGWWQLKAGSMVGAATLTTPAGQAITLRITPKLPIARLFFLLGYALNPKGWQQDAVDVAEHADLLPALAHTYERQLERALRQGTLQGYRTTEETSLLVRGRIREADQIRRHYGLALPVEVSFDEYTVDIPENQLLRAATERLLRLPAIPTLTRRRLLSHRARLADAAALVRGHVMPDWRPSRLNSRYHPALHLAGIILRDSSVEHIVGDLRVNGFLFDMNKLFEDFVCVALREDLHGRGGRTELQGRGIHLDEADTVRIRPDFVWYDASGHARAVVDAKYKAEQPEGFPDADLYQLLAYCTALHLPAGHLIYAKGNPHTSHRIRNAGIRIHQHALDLDQPPKGLLGDISSIANALSDRQHASGS
ncbi:McrC family protein [Streptomyces sp. H39-C1]|uniref:McrC family protein n=1 Tax=Streptomyces sp. H39-C1 TaxID=3004355 RepID=UPI0022AF7087|nr:restriction endonuclease [Streptomyces sp. H39-C1]MCZ4100807.1 restriction endonuclease [Streptomyces sp. H39-C1]